MLLLLRCLIGCMLVLSCARAAAGPLAQFRTTLGEIDVELFDVDKPATVGNFVHYVSEGKYANSFAHRWDPGFVLQGGGLRVIERGTTNAFLSAVVPFPAVTNEYSVGRTFSNQYGTIAMARVDGETNSATSQWFFNLGNNARLDRSDGGFTVFGRVVGGTNVLNRFIPTSPTNGVYQLTGLARPLNELPITSREITLSTLFNYLIYVDVTMLRVEIATQTQGGRIITWQSVNGRTNHVEFTTRVPPVWEELAWVSGTGERVHVTDLAEGTSRVYRVRIDF